MAPQHWEEKFDSIWLDSIKGTYYHDFDEDLFDYRVEIIDLVQYFPYYISQVSSASIHPFVLYPSYDLFTISFFDSPDPTSTVTISGCTILANELSFQLLNLLSSHSDNSIHF